MNRREFLRGIVLSAGAASLSGCRSLAGFVTRTKTERTVFISDVHVHPDSYQLERFRLVVDEILQLRPRPTKVVCFGDISFLYGVKEDYEASRPEFQRLLDAGIQLTFGLGNHDRRDAFLAVWPEYRERMLMKDFVVSEVDLGCCDLIMLDTLHEPDTPETKERGWITPGQFREQRMEWLQTEMARRTRPFLLGAHHAIREITDGDWKSLNDLVMECELCRGWIHGHDHLWEVAVSRRSTSTWADNRLKRRLSLPSTGHWGDIGYAVVDASENLLRIEYRGLDHFVPTPDERTAMDEDLVAEKNGAFMLIRM